MFGIGLSMNVGGSQIWSFSKEKRSPKIIPKYTYTDKISEYRKLTVLKQYILTVYTHYQIN